MPISAEGDDKVVGGRMNDTAAGLLEHMGGRDQNNKMT